MDNVGLSINVKKHLGICHPNKYCKEGVQQRSLFLTPKFVFVVILCINMSKKLISDGLRLAAYIVISIWIYIFAYDFYIVLLSVFITAIFAKGLTNKGMKNVNLKNALMYSVIVLILSMAGYCTFLFCWIDLLSKILVKIVGFVYWSILTD